MPKSTHCVTHLVANDIVSVTKPKGREEEEEEGMGAHAKIVDLEHCGRGEVARLVMCAAGLDFEDIRISRAEWNLVKKCKIVYL